MWLSTRFLSRTCAGGMISMLRMLLWLAVALLVVNGMSVKSEERLSLRVSIAQILQTPRPVRTIVIGDPSIFDVVVQDEQTLILTGYIVGSTNLVLLDENKEVILDNMVDVKAYEEDTVFVHRALVRSSYSCTPICAISATVGDDDESFNMSIDQNKAKKAQRSGTTGMEDTSSHP